MNLFEKSYIRKILVKSCRGIIFADSLKPALHKTNLIFMIAKASPLGYTVLPANFVDGRY